MRRLNLALALTLGISGIFLGLQAAPPEKDTAPTGKGVGTLQHPPMPDQANGNPSGNAGFRISSSTITYHGGPVMTNQAHIYYIWYGDWTGNSGVSLLEYFAANIGSSTYYRINTSYKNGAGVPVPANAVFQGATAVPKNSDGSYRYGTSLSDAQIKQIVIDSIAASGKVPDPDGIYFVLTSADVTASSGFCTQYCGWHSYSTMSINGGSGVVKYSFVGNAARCLSACSAQTTSPNNNPGADAMASIIAHELEEAVTDPQLNAWYDGRGYENADKCAWKFGTVFTTTNGSAANMKLGSSQLNFLIQQNWLNVGAGSCALSN